MNSTETLSWTIVAMLFAVLTIPVRLAAQEKPYHQPTIITFDPPGSTATYPDGINAAGMATGSYYLNPA